MDTITLYSIRIILLMIDKTLVASDFYCACFEIVQALTLNNRKGSLFVLWVFFISFYETIEMHTLFPRGWYFENH